jgi:hypothetical protein
MDNGRYEDGIGRKKETKEYKAWCGMMARCYNNKSSSYPLYGGRGIFVCERWKKSFENFLRDMGKSPTKNHSLDRINNGGPYSPKNCKWSTDKEQCLNRRSNIIVEYGGEKYVLSELSKKLNIPYPRMRWRYHQGMSIDDIVDLKRRNEKLIDGKTMVERSRELGVHRSTLYRRLKQVRV